jgi:hypothetical protein
MKYRIRYGGSFGSQHTWDIERKAWWYLCWDHVTTVWGSYDLAVATMKMIQEKEKLTP